MKLKINIDQEIINKKHKNYELSFQEIIDYFTQLDFTSFTSLSLHENNYLPIHFCIYINHCYDGINLNIRKWKEDGHINIIDKDFPNKKEIIKEISAFLQLEEYCCIPLKNEEDEK